MKQKENFYSFEEIPGNMEAGLVLICDHVIFNFFDIVEIIVLPVN